RNVADLLPEDFLREHQIIPLGIELDGSVTLAIQDPTNRASQQAASELLGRPTQFVGTTRTDIRDGLERLFHEQYLDHSAGDLMRRSPNESAHRVLSTPQKWFF